MLLLDNGILDLLTEAEECTTNLWLQLIKSDIQTAIQSVAADDLTVTGRQDDTTGAEREERRETKRTKIGR